MALRNFSTKVLGVGVKSGFSGLGANVLPKRTLHSNYAFSILSDTSVGLAVPRSQNFSVSAAAKWQGKVKVDEKNDTQEQVDNLVLLIPGQIENPDHMKMIFGDSMDSFEMIKRTYQPSVLKRKRRHGFLKRSKSPGGRNVLKSRQMKGRKRLSA